MKQFFNIDQNKIFRRKLRNNATKPERILWKKLKSKQLGYKFRRQHGIESFIVDFYCPELRIVIEIDGMSHDSPDQIEKDKLREQFFQQEKIKIIHINNDEILNNVDKVMECLDAKINKC